MEGGEEEREREARESAAAVVCLLGVKKSMMNDRRTDHKEGEKVTTHTRVD